MGETKNTFKILVGRYEGGGGERWREGEVSGID
jgi:hypothetical protein